MTARAVLNGRAGCKNYKLVPCSKKKVSGEPSLPDELIFYILVWLPAHVLYNSTRYVCWQWYKIIHDPLFCKEQLLHSSTGLLLQDHHVPHIAQFAEFGEMSATLTDIKFKFPSRVLSTCNGLVLFCNPHDPSTLHVANPLTKQTVTVPPLKCHPDGSCISFACAYSKMGYKVLCTYGPDGDKHNCVMLTLGKDNAWKQINRQKLSDRGWSMIKYRPFSIGQFLYWADRREKSVVVLDVESELFNEFRSPAVLTWRSHTSIFYQRRGRTLSCSLMTKCRSLMDVLVLSDPTSGEWRMLYKIDFGAQKHLLTGMNHASFPPSGDEALLFVPIAWVNKGDVLVLYISRPSGYSGSYFAFNVKTGNFFKVGSKDYCVFDVCCGYAHSLDSPTPTEVTIHK
ncbi:uncharacterized protein LOC131326360 [Rhododendron vialii]|uniref:uncharacterized protein LOC131326360 n=1 Tax=Rhododendron vialii TaxID=182163 RepID=UPI00265DF0D3|nr:uncharacterized protein LOC131326360 [Rhododendron vialii]XP_058215099.1 uncharacterized protein LOC131326360 [Rhododendron vialii]